MRPDTTTTSSRERNPLADLCEQMSLDGDALAQAIGVTRPQLTAALAEEPKEPLATYLRACRLLGLKLRVPCRNMSLWFDLRAIDALHESAAFRKSLGMDELPANREALRKLIRVLRRRRWSYSEIVVHFEKNFIPTTEGHRQWRRSTIGQHLKRLKRGSDGGMALAMTDAYRREFRRFVAARLLVAICPFDVFASVRYQMDWREASGRLRIEAKESLPAPLERWMVAAVAKLGWFTEGAWGHGIEETKASPARMPECMAVPGVETSSRWDGGGTDDPGYGELGIGHAPGDAAACGIEAETAAA